jgi:hypothetical protein
MHRTKPAHCSVRPSSISKPAHGNAGVNWPGPPSRWLARTSHAVLTSRRSDHASTPTASCRSDRCHLSPGLHAPHMQPPPHVQRLKLTPGRWHHAPDSCAAARHLKAMLSANRYRPAATSAPCAAHAAAAHAPYPLAIGPEEKPFTPLPTAAIELSPLRSPLASPLLQALGPCHGQRPPAKERSHLFLPKLRGLAE